MRCGACGASMEARTRSHGQRRVLFYGCSAYHQKGSSICRNSLTLPAFDFEETVLDAIESMVLAPEVVQAAVVRAVATLQRPDDTPPAEDRRAQVDRLERELRQLTTAIAAGGAMDALLEAVRVREAERDTLLHAMKAEEALAAVRDVSPSRLHAQLLERLGDWRTLLRSQVTQAQQILRRLLTGPLVCTPQPERCYRLTGTATLGRLLEGQVPVMVASPTGLAVVRTVPHKRLRVAFHLRRAASSSCCGWQTAARSGGGTVSSRTCRRRSRRPSTRSGRRRTTPPGRYRRFRWTS